MERALGLTTLIVSLVLLWSRTRRLRFSSLAATVLTGLELLAVGFAVASLGWWGVVALGLVNVLAVLIWSMILAARVESKLVYAATRANESRQTMKALAKRLGQRRELRAVGPTERAELIALLADRDHYVLPELTPEQVQAIVASQLSMDTLVRESTDPSRSEWPRCRITPQHLRSRPGSSRAEHAVGRRGSIPVGKPVT